MFFTKETSKGMIDINVDEYGDSFARDTDVNELKNILDQMPKKSEAKFSLDELKRRLEEQQYDLSELPGWMFWGMVLYMHPPAADFEFPQREQDVILRVKLASNAARFGGANITNDLDNTEITHIVLGVNDRDRLRELRKEVSS